MIAIDTLAGFRRALSSCACAMLTLVALNLLAYLGSAQVVAHPLSSASPEQATELKSIEGAVVNSITGQPIKRALVTLSGTTQRAVLTDDDGKFAFDHVQPGMMAVQARRPGFFANENRPVYVDTQSPGAVELRLTPTSVIYGQVTGQDDEPLEGVPVQVFQSVIAEGRRRWTPAGTANSDADGNFRIHDLRTGIFKISAGPTLGRNLGKVGYPTTYYQNALDRKSATALQVAPAQQREINFQLRPKRVYRVRGMVVGGPAGSFEKRGVGIWFCDNSDTQISTYMRFEPATGGFEAMLPAGSYIVRATSSDETGNMLQARVSLQVANNVDGLTLELKSEAPIAVIVHSEFVRPAAMQSSQLPTVRIGAAADTGAIGASASVPSASVRLIPASDGGNEAYSQWDGSADKPVLLRNVEPGKYEVQISPIGNFGSSQGTVYVASARSGGTDLLSEPLTVKSAGDVDPIDIELRDDSAMLEGTVRGAKRDGLVLVVSDIERKRIILGNYGADGHFYASPLPPGSYTVYALDHFDEIEYTDREALRPFESRAAHVMVSANQTARITLDVVETEK